jgi:hypothetical protein
MSLFYKGYKLYYRHMVIQLHINKEMCIFLHTCFHYFIHLLNVRCGFKKDCVDSVIMTTESSLQQMTGCCYKVKCSLDDCSLKIGVY